MEAHIHCVSLFFFFLFFFDSDVSGGNFMFQSSVVLVSTLLAWNVLDIQSCFSKRKTYLVFLRMCTYVCFVLAREQRQISNLFLTILFLISTNSKIDVIFGKYCYYNFNNVIINNFNNIVIIFILISILFSILFRFRLINAAVYV